MSRLRTHNRRRLRLMKGWHKPICCPKHGVPFRGNGWVYAAGHRFGMFECPKPLCKRFHLWRDTGEATATIGQQDGGK
ncbi:hypothetical protein [Sphingomonas sp. DC1100-1]|uniref:hypothetical protein n=1 Tax=unclassified Sphingomonas TaxID=196159 RepID=UPI003CF1F762